MLKLDFGKAYDRVFWSFLIICSGRGSLLDEGNRLLVAFGRSMFPSLLMVLLLVFSLC